MTYVAAANRYDRMIYNRCGRSGLELPAVSLGLWQNFGHERPLETSRAIVRRAFDLGITHFDLANNYGPPYGSAEETFGRLLEQDLAPVPRRARDLDQGRLRHVAGPVRRVGLSQVPAREPRPEPAADGSRLRRHLLLAPLRPGHPARGDDGRPRRRGTPGKGALRRDLVLLARQDARGGGDPGRARHAAPDPSAVVLDAEPLDRGGAARHPRAARSRLHRLLAARAGNADRQVPRRRSRRVEGEPQRVALPRPAQRRGARADPRPERDRARPRADAGADGARLDAARPAGDLDALRREQRRAARRGGRGARAARLLTGRARRDRPSRGRQRNQHLGRVEQALRRHGIPREGSASRSITSCSLG